MESKIIQGDCLEVLKTLEDESVDCVITSPPYYALRDYGADGQIGLEESPDAYVDKMVEVFREVRRILKKRGTLWLNLGDTYNGVKVGNTETEKNKTRVTSSFVKHKSKNLRSKDLIGIPWKVAFALQKDGWILRQDIIWHKPNPMPESVTDRCTKAHEYIFLFAKSEKYHYNAEAIQEPAIYGGTQERAERQNPNNKYMPTATVNGIRPRDRRAGAGRFEYDGKYDGSIDLPTRQKAFVVIKENRNKRSVWSVTTKPFSGAHFATFPESLIEPMVLAGCPQGGVVLDPFFGAGTTGVVAKKLGAKYLGIELNPEYIKIAEKRIAAVTPPMFSVIPSPSLDSPEGVGI